MIYIVKMNNLGSRSFKWSFLVYFDFDYFASHEYDKEKMLFFFIFRYCWWERVGLERPVWDQSYLRTMWPGTRRDSELQVSESVKLRITYIIQRSFKGVEWWFLFGLSSVLGFIFGHLLILRQMSSRSDLTKSVLRCKTRY